jgi:hypothetical protein
MIAAPWTPITFYADSTVATNLPHPLATSSDTDCSLCVLSMPAKLGIVASTQKVFTRINVVNLKEDRFITP